MFEKFKPRYLSAALLSIFLAVGVPESKAQSIANTLPETSALLRADDFVAPHDNALDRADAVEEILPLIEKMGQIKPDGVDWVIDKVLSSGEKVQIRLIKYIPLNELRITVYDTQKSSSGPVVFLRVSIPEGTVLESQLPVLYKGQTDFYPHRREGETDAGNRIFLGITRLILNKS